MEAQSQQPQIIKTRECEITQNRQTILEYLADHRFATTAQLYQELQMPLGISRKHTERDMRRMGQAGLVKSRVGDVTKGNNAEYVWLITPKGIETIGRNYTNNYNRKPSQERLKLRDMELELVRTIGFAGVDGASWSVIEPVAYSSARPMPATTPQYFKLVEAVDFITAGQIWADLLQGRVKPEGQSVTHFRQAQQRLSVPKQVNDYVAYLNLSHLEVPLVEPTQGSGNQRISNNKLLSVLELRSWAARASEHYTGIGAGGLPIKGTVAIVLILCPPKVGPKFWAAKLNRYARLARALPVYGVFEKETSRQVGEKQLQQLAQSEKNKWLVSGYGSHLNTITLAGIYELLERIASTHAEPTTITSLIEDNSSITTTVNTTTTNTNWTSSHSQQRAALTWQ